MHPTPTCSGFIFSEDSLRTPRRARAEWLRLFALLSALLLLHSGPVRAADTALEVIPLRHRSAAELLPLIQPFVAKDGVIKADNARLIIRTAPANLAELRGLIAKLDRPLRRLLITVKQLAGDAARDGGAEPGGSGAKVWRTDPRDDANRMQQVQVTEGEPAFIDAGRQIPITDFALGQTRSGTVMGQQTRYAAATTGFFVRARLEGDTVTVEIGPHQTVAAGSESPPAFNVQALHTTVTGKLGEWIAIGASSADVDREDKSAIVYSTGGHDEQERRILLRVTAPP